MFNYFSKDAIMPDYKVFGEALEKITANPPWNKNKIIECGQWNPYSLLRKYLMFRNDNIILNTSGFYGDVLQLKRVLQFRFDYRQDLSVDLCSMMLSRTLYSKRFFPYYTGVVLCGIDEFGKGAVYSYDPVGCLERVQNSCSGAAEPMLQPFLDNQVDFVTIDPNTERPKWTVERATSLLRDAFRFVAERETSTGDQLRIVVAEAGKPVKISLIPLRED